MLSSQSNLKLIFKLARAKKIQFTQIIMSYRSKEIDLCRTNCAETVQMAPDLLSIALKTCRDFTSN